MALKKLRHDINSAILFAERSKLDFCSLKNLKSVQRLKQLSARDSRGVSGQQATLGGSSTNVSEDPLDPEREGSSVRRKTAEARRSQNGRVQEDLEPEARSRDADGSRARNCKRNFPDITSNGHLKHKGVISLVCVTFVALVTLSSRIHPLQLIEALIGAEQREECHISVPSSWKDKVRPPVDCIMCKNVTSVRRVSDVDPVDFFSDYVETGRPVVVTDAMDDWRATQAFSYEFFKTLYASKGSVFLDKFEDARCQFFPYKTEFRSLRDVFEMDADRAQMRPGFKPWYVGWGSCDGEINEILRQYYQRPYFLPRTSEGSRMDWIFMGTSGFGAHMHVDHVRHPSWQAQVKGEKLWLLQPPPECYFICRDLEVTVKPGEILVLDTNRWYHSTQVASDNISITIGSEFD